MEDLDNLSKFNSSFEELIGQLNDVIEGKIDFFKEKLAEIKCRVIVIGYGEVENGRLWKENLKFPFDVYVDKDRKLFKYFKMARSFKRVGKMDNIYNYVETYVMKGIPQIESVYKDEDPLQEGGDIIFRQDGQNVFEYVSIATNRPKIQDVIEFVQNFTK